MSAPAMSRRRLLGWMAGGGAWLGLGGLAGLGCSALRGGEDPDGVVAGIGRVGAAHLDGEAAGDTAQDLSTGVPHGWEPPTSVPLSDLAVLGEAARADFASGRTVDVAGWRLARTEADAAALIALRAGAA